MKAAISLMGNHMRKALNEYQYFIIDPDFGGIRVPINLDVRMGNVTLRDQFEWDMNEPRNKG